VPLCVLATPFWDVSIEGGAVSDPEQLVSGYQTNAYPLPAPLHGHTVEHTPLTIIILSHTALPSIVKALDDLFDSFKGAFLQATSSMRRKHDH
jgi:hypothetical protein